MARNKYPEVTIEKILDVSQRLFLEKGYDNTTIQDIVDSLGGLTKGAVYHHFKSKEEIMNAVGERMFFSNNPFDAVRGRTDLNGLEKLREVVRSYNADAARTRMTVQAIPIMQNPRILVELIESNRRILTPYFQELIEEGNRDGSLHTEYAHELAELLPLLSSLWLLPSVFPATPAELKRKFRFIGDMLSQMGVPLIDDAILALGDDLLAQL
ncbi:MAG: TetR/AcrR family transcriptional regulator [Clostridiaceae bacterium]|nr:TetR/AcrR family transcriptional regulator [Clostridiaceae bacterium]